MLGLGATIRTDRCATPADDFLQGFLFEIALQPGELIVSVEFAVQEQAYVTFERPASRFASVGAFVSHGQARGRVAGVRVGVTGAKTCAGTDDHRATLIASLTRRALAEATRSA